MQTSLMVTEMVLPVLLMIALGWWCRKKGLFGAEGLAGIKAVVANITLPVVLFNAFYTARYNLTSLLMFAVVFGCSSAALAAGYLLRRLTGGRYGKLMPFLFSGFEVGMLGYALFTLLAGAENIHFMATVDLGQVLFVYTVYLALLRAETGERPTVKTTVVNMLKNPAFLGMALGMLVGITGLGRMVTGSALGGVFTGAVAFVTAPTAGMILIIVGYELSMSSKLLGPVLLTLLARLLVMGALLAVSALIVFAVIPFDKTLFTAMVLLFSLPAPFIIPLYSDVAGEGEYISTTLSMGTLVTVAIFAGLAAYTLA